MGDSWLPVTINNSALPEAELFKSVNAAIASESSGTTSASEIWPKAAETALSHPASTLMRDATLPRIGIPLSLVRSAPLPSLWSVA